MNLMQSILISVYVTISGSSPLSLSSDILPRYLAKNMQASLQSVIVCLGLNITVF